MDTFGTDLTWTIEDGFDDPLDVNYPRNEVGGILGDEYMFVLNRSMTNGKLCSLFDGFQVMIFN